MYGWLRLRQTLSTFRLQRASATFGFFSRLSQLTTEAVSLAFLDTDDRQRIDSGVIGADSRRERSTWTRGGPWLDRMMLALVLWLHLLPPSAHLGQERARNAQIPVLRQGSHRNRLAWLVSSLFKYDVSFCFLLGPLDLPHDTELLWKTATKGGMRMAHPLLS